MSQRVEQWRHELGLLNRPKKPKMIKGEIAARYHWRVLRNCIRNVSDEVSKQDRRDYHIAHGIQFYRKINHVHPIKQVLFLRPKDEYVTLDGQYIRTFKGNGRKKDVISHELSFTRLVYVDHVDQFVGWAHGSPNILILDSNFEIITESTAQSGLVQAMYNEDTGDIITTEPGKIDTWVFRYGNRHLLPRKSIAEGIAEECELDLLALERTASHAQRLFAAVEKNVLVFNLHEAKLITELELLHTREITAISFFNPLKLLITASRDGSIKVWEPDFRLRMVFVGHDDAVHRLDMYPFGPMITSISADKTLRVWSLELVDEVDRVSLDVEAWDMGVVIGRERFYSVSTNCVDLWRVNQLHLHHTSTAGADVVCIKVTDHPAYPVRGVAFCSDAFIHVVCPRTGHVLTSAVSPRPKRVRLIDAAYAIEDGVLFAAYSDGVIAKFSTRARPCLLEAEWPCENANEQVNYLLVYEYVISTAQGWSGFKKMFKTKAIEEESGGEEEEEEAGNKANSKKERKNKTLLLGGRKDGYICVYNWQTGGIDFKVEAHGSKGVLSMVANSSHDQLISAGKDNIIKVWRMYPFAQESLAPLMSFFCAHLPLHMSVFKQTLLVAFQEPQTATYSVVLHNLESKNRYDHSPDDDHIDNFTGVSCCSRLKIFATGSADGTIRIWNEGNRLVRVLHLHHPASALGFCSERGDLLIGIGAHLYFIDHRKYLPQAYLRKMVMMAFHEEQPPGEPLQFDAAILARLRSEDAKRVQLAQGSFKFDKYADVLSEAEAELLAAERTLKGAAFALLAQREEELRKIRDGELVAKHHAKPTKQTRSHAFHKYLKMFYDRPKIPLPLEPMIEDAAQRLYEENMGKKKKAVRPEAEKFQPEKSTGFFPPVEAAAKLPAGEEVPRAGGFLPNSVLLRILFPAEAIRAQADTWKPPAISSDQMAQLAAAAKKKKKKKPKADRETSNVSFALTEEEEEETALFFDWEDDEEEAKATSEAATPVGRSGDEEEEPMVLFELASDRKKKEEAEVKAAPPKSDFLQRMQTLLDRPPTPKSPEPEPEPEPVPKKAPVRAGPARKVMTREELMAKRPGAADTSGRASPPAIAIRRPPPRAKAPGAATPATPPSRQTATRDRPRTPPLPDYVRQFSAAPWFQRRFPPPVKPDDLPQPLTASSFCSAVVGQLRAAPWSERCELLQAVLTLHVGEPLAGHCIQGAKHAVLAALDEGASLTEEQERRFIEAALKGLVSLQLKDRDVMGEILLWYFDGDDGLQTLVGSILAHMGVNDPHSYFPRELNSWDLLGVAAEPGGQRRRELRQVVEAWLDKWLASFKIHVKDAVEKLRKGEEVGGKLERNRSDASGGGILKKGRRGGKAEEGGVLTVTFETPPDAGLAESATYIEAINYFCETAHEKKLSKMRQPGKSRRKRGAAEEVGESPEVRNTVLVLPQLPARRQCLVRLGESHTEAVPRRHSEQGATPVTHDFTQPACLQPAANYRHTMEGGFVPMMHLPLKQCRLNPFPSPWDDLEWPPEKPLTVMLRCVQKFFVPELSYVQQG